MLGDPGVESLVAPAQQREAVEAGELTGDALVEAAARRAEQVQRPGWVDGLDRGEDGPGESTMPAPPPYGASSTERCTSVVCARQIVYAQVEKSRGPRLADQARVEVRVDDRGEDREDVDADGAQARRLRILTRRTSRVRPSATAATGAAVGAALVAGMRLTPAGPATTRGRASSRFTSTW